MSKSVFLRFKERRKKTKILILQVSFIIVDDADMELEMCNDPFLEAGIAIPAELPYQDESQRENSARLVVGKSKTGQHQRMTSVGSQQLQFEMDLETDPEKVKMNSQHPSRLRHQIPIPIVKMNRILF